MQYLSEYRYTIYRMICRRCRLGVNVGWQGVETPLPQGWAAPCPLDNSVKQTQIETNADKQDDTDEAVEGEESRIEATQIFRVDQTVFIDESYSHQDQSICRAPTSPIRQPFEARRPVIETPRSSTSKLRCMARFFRVIAENPLAKDSTARYLSASWLAVA